MSTQFSCPTAAEVFALLGNRRRLLVVRYLSLFSCGQTVSVRHVARVICGIETNTPPSQVTSTAYESVYNGLIQNHLPRMHEHGLIQYDERGKEIGVLTDVFYYAYLVSLVSLPRTLHQ
ncbi:DUF7344 domain-containing protein [Haloferax gibbonsii]